MSGLIRTLLRLFYFLIYHPFAWTYDAVAALVSAGYWRRWVLAMLDEIEGESLLELGHGPGHLQLALHQSGRWALGLDRSRQMGRLASRRLLKQCAPVRLSNAVSQQLPFPTGHFDEVVATFPTGLHHRSSHPGRNSASTRAFRPLAGVGRGHSDGQERSGKICRAALQADRAGRAEPGTLAKSARRSHS